MKSVSILFLFSLLIWVGCSKNNSDNDPQRTEQESSNSIDSDTTAQIFQGIYFSGPQLRKIHLCDRKEDLWVIDSTRGDLDAQYYKLKLGPHQPAYVELEGEIFPTKDSAIAKRFKNTFYVYWVDLVEKFKNQIDCPNYELIFKGQGQEPPWQISISKNEIVFLLGYGKDKTIYPYHDPVIDKGTKTFKSSLTDVLGESSISIVVTASECFDVMTGDKYNYSVQIIKDEKIYFGCGEDMTAAPQ